MAADLTVTPTADGLALGAPRLTMTYHGTTPDGASPTRVFAQLVDDATGLVIGNQITPVDITLDGKGHTASSDLEVIAQHLEPGRTITLQMVATTPAYATPRLGGKITFDSLAVSLPVATGVKRSGT